MSEEAGEYKTKVQLPSQIKKEQDQSTETGDAKIRALAQKWAELHAKPKQRDKMDELLANLSPETQRKIVLCGQRIAAGLSPKIVN